MNKVEDIEGQLRKVVFEGLRISLDPFRVKEPFSGGLPKEGRQRITPDQARKLLTRTRRNRALRPAMLKFLVAEINEGRWRYNGQTIGFNEKGALNDGQHRLWACVLTDKPIDVGVALGVPDDAFLVTDTGRPRQAKDMLSLLGFQGTVALAAAARWGLLYQHDKITYRGGKQIAETMSAEVIVEFVKAHPELLHASEIYNDVRRKLDRILPPSVVIFALFKMREADAPAATVFINKLVTGAGLKVGEPVYTLRERLLDERSRLNRKLPYQVLLAFLIKAWNAEVGQETMERLTFRQMDHYPRFAHDEKSAITVAPPIASPRHILRRKRKSDVEPEVTAPDMVENAS